MATHQTLQEIILLELRKRRDCEMDLLVDQCSTFTWNEIFNEVDQLRRTGKICLKKHGLTGYSLVLASDNSRGTLLSTRPNG